MSRRSLLALGLALAFMARERADALQLQAVDIRGVDATAAANVRAQLALDRLGEARRADLSEAQLSFYLRALPDEVRAGLEPLGYYDVASQVRVTRDGDKVTVHVDIAPGKPVTVRKLALAVDGPAAADAAVTARLAAFRPRPGAVLRHDQYEQGKRAVARALDEHGYFDAELDQHRVEVTRATATADIDLHWRSGPRLALGPVRFEGAPFRPGLLDKLVPWQPGTPYDVAQLRRLQQTLGNLDYFAAVSLAPDIEHRQGEQVPVVASLVPAKRSVYRAGVRMGTDSGAGVDGGLERRWLNKRGHKLAIDLAIAQHKSALSAEYRIPAFVHSDGWWALSSSLRRELINDIDTQYADAALTRSGHWRDWSAQLGLNYRRERFDSVLRDMPQREFTTVVYPMLAGQWSTFDDPVYPRRGQSVSFEVRAGATAIGSDINFAQARIEGRAVRALANDWRVLARAELGVLRANDNLTFPPSLRFYAGGDRSIRGYGYKDIGQRALGVNVGGRHLAVASLELEHMVTPTWGGAVFVDAGDAFDDRLDLHRGIGAGLRWRSPVGPVRVDLARGLDGPSPGWRLHVTIGPDL